MIETKMNFSKFRAIFLNDEYVRTGTHGGFLL